MFCFAVIEVEIGLYLLLQHH